MQPIILLVVIPLALGVAVDNGNQLSSIQQLKQELRHEFEQKQDQLRKELIKQQLEFNQREVQLRNHHQDQLNRELSIMKLILDDNCKEKGQFYENIIQRDHYRNTNDSDLEERVTELEGYVEILEETVIVHEKHIQTIQSQMEGLSEQMDDINEEFSNIQEAVEGLETTDTQHSTEIQSLQGRVQSLEDSAVDDERYSFMAALTSNHGVGFIVFDRVHHNRGNVYDASRGIWTAPVNGIYHFTTQLEVLHVGVAFVRFYVDGEWAAAANSVDVGYDDYVTITTITELELSAGQEVQVHANDAYCVFGCDCQQIQSSFSGHLIQI